MNQTTLNAQLYAALKDTAAKIQAADRTLGFYARRKVDFLSATSGLAELVRAGDDMLVIARKAGIES